MALHNRINKEELKEQLMAENFKRITISFYKYFKIEDPETYRNTLYRDWAALNCFGRVYLAEEGINAQMSIPEHHYDDFIAATYHYDDLNQVPIKIAVEDDGKSFYKLIVKVREKIVADGIDDASFDASNVGNHLDAKAFNDALNEDDTIVIDMRNFYESEVGHFEGAVCPDVSTFRESLPKLIDEFEEDKDKKVLMYCTGGIRCEKASAYFKHNGFKDVNQLHGGIIDYVRQVKSDDGLENKFIGKNFVFDDRLGERVTEDVISKCHQCETPSDNHINCANDACHVLFIQCPSCAVKYNGCCSAECRDFLLLPPEVQEKEKHKFKDKKEGEFKRRKVKL